MFLREEIFFRAFETLDNSVRDFVIRGWWEEDSVVPCPLMAFVDLVRRIQ